MAIPSVVNWPGVRELSFPVSGAGSNIPAGTLLMPGVTGGTNYGVAIPITAASNLGGIGVLGENHIYGSSGDATTATLVRWFPLPGLNGASTALGVSVGSNNGPFPSHPLTLFSSATVLQIDYSLVSTVAVVSQTTTTTVVTSFEDNFDGGYYYVNAGTGIGQLMFIKASSSGNITTGTAPTVSLDSTSKLTKVLPFFHTKPVWKINTTTVPNTLDSTAAIGTGRASVVGQYIVKNGAVSRLDPYIHNNMQGLNSVNQFSLFAQVQVIDTILDPLA